VSVAVVIKFNLTRELRRSIAPFQQQN